MSPKDDELTNGADPTNGGIATDGGDAGDGDAPDGPHVDLSELYASPDDPSPFAPLFLLADSQLFFRGAGGGANDPAEGTETRNSVPKERW